MAHSKHNLCLYLTRHKQLFSQKHQIETNILKDWIRKQVVTFGTFTYCHPNCFDGKTNGWVNCTKRLTAVFVCIGSAHNIILVHEPLASAQDLLRTNTWIISVSVDKTKWKLSSKHSQTRHSKLFRCHKRSHSRDEGQTIVLFDGKQDGNRYVERLNHETSYEKIR